MSIPPSPRLISCDSDDRSSAYPPQREVKKNSIVPLPADEAIHPVHCAVNRAIIVAQLERQSVHVEGMQHETNT